MNSNLLKGEKVLLRALEPEDLESLYKWENDTEIWNISETLSPVSRFILKKYLENSHKDIFETKQIRFIIQSLENNSPLGTIDLFDFDHFHKRAAMGILIAEKDNRKRGYAREAIELLKSYCRDVLKLNQIYCTVSVTNKASVDLFTRAGFQITGTRSKWNYTGHGYIDEHFLQLIF